MRSTVLFADDGAMRDGRDSRSRHCDDERSIPIGERLFAGVDNYDNDAGFVSVDKWRMKTRTVAEEDRTNQLCEFRYPTDNHLHVESSVSDEQNEGHFTRMATRLATMSLSVRFQ